MIHAFRSEWIKFHTARANLVLIICAIAVPTTITGLIGSLAGLKHSDGEELASIILGPLMVCLILAGVLGVLAIGQEYRHSTIRTTFTAMPRRSTVIAAKVGSTALFGAALGALALVISTALFSIIMSIRGISFSPSGTDHFGRAAVGFVLICAMFALWGFAAGALLRQPAGAIPLLLVYALVVEGLLGGLLGLAIDGNVLKWMPFQEGASLSQLHRGSDWMSWPFGLLYTAAFTGLLVAAGWLVVERRDA